MNVQNILDTVMQNAKTANDYQTDNQSPLASISSLLPGGLLEGAAAGGVMALLLGSKSSRKLAKKVATLGGTVVLGGLAFKAHGNWQQNKALGQTQPASDQDIQITAQSASALDNNSQAIEQSTLTMTLIKTMVAASKANGNIDASEHKKLSDAIEKVALSADHKAAVFDLMSRNITVQEIADSVSLDKHKAEVYLSAYLAIKLDNQSERTFLNNLEMALDLPRGFPAYLEQQADQGVAT